jgi:hypothetical protein
MPLFADDFQAGALISLLIPACLLIAIAVWYVMFARRTPDSHPSSPALPSSDMVAAAAERSELPQPAGPPPGEIR